jgi:small-conductance mechanosensitive channel
MLEEPQWRAAPAPTAARAAAAAQPAVRTLDPPLPRRRLRSAVLLVALVVTIGAVLAAVVGIVVTALALALRAAVTS